MDIIILILIIIFLIGYIILIIKISSDTIICTPSCKNKNECDDDGCGNRCPCSDSSKTCKDYGKNGVFSCDPTPVTPFQKFKQGDVLLRDDNAECLLSPVNTDKDAFHTTSGFQYIGPKDCFSPNNMKDMSGDYEYTYYKKTDDNTNFNCTDCDKDFITCKEGIEKLCSS